MTDNQTHKAGRKYVSLILRAGVAVIACALIAAKVEFREVANSFSEISAIALIAIIVVFMVSQTILTLRWWFFMRALDIYIPFFNALKLSFLGLYFNNFLPGAVGGDVVRAWYVAQHTHKRMPAVISVVVDRVLALLGTFLIALIALLFAGQKDILRRQESAGILNVIFEHKMLIITILGIITAAIIVIVLSPAGRNKLKYKYLYQKILTHGKSGLQSLIQSGLVLIKKPYVTPFSLMLTFVLQGLVILSMGMIGKEVGIPADWEVYFLILPVMWVVGSVPISISGIGIVEGGMIALFVQIGGATAAQAMTLAVCQRAVWLIASLPGLLVYLSGKHLPADFAKEFSVDENARMQ